MVDDFTFAAMNAMTANHADRVAALNDRINKLLEENGNLRKSLAQAHAQNSILWVEADRLDEVRQSLLDDAKRMIEKSYEDGKKDGWEQLKSRAQAEIDKLNGTISELKGDLAKERNSVAELEDRLEWKDTVITYADSVMAGQAAQIARFQQSHPDSDLLQPSDALRADGQPRTRIQAVYDQAFSAMFRQSGGTPEVQKQLAELGVDVSPLDAAPLPDETAPASPAP